MNKERPDVASSQCEDMKRSEAADARRHAAIRIKLVVAGQAVSTVATRHKLFHYMNTCINKRVFDFDNCYTSSEIVRVAMSLLDRYYGLCSYTPQSSLHLLCAVLVGMSTKLLVGCTFSGAMARAVGYAKGMTTKSRALTVKKVENDILDRLNWDCIVRTPDPCVAMLLQTANELMLPDTPEQPSAHYLHAATGEHRRGLFESSARTFLDASVVTVSIPKLLAAPNLLPLVYCIAERAYRLK